MAKSGVCLAVAFLGFLAVAFLLTGTIYPAWVRIRTDLKEINEEMLIIPSSVKEIDIEMGLESDSDSVPKPVAMPQRGSDSSSNEEDEDEDEWFLEFLTDTAGGDTAVLIEHIEDFKVTIDVGFMFSRVCVSRDLMGTLEEGVFTGKCKCKTVRTEHAVSQFSFLFTPRGFTDAEQTEPRLNCRGWGRLNLQRGAAILAVSLTLLGLIFGILGFRKQNACRCFRVSSMLAMFCASVLIGLQVTGAARLNILLHNNGIDVKCPISAVIAGIGGLFSAICFIVTLAGVCSSARKQAPGTWYRFNNDLVTEKKPSLVFLDDALPEKVDLGFTPSVSDTDMPPELLEKANKM